MTRPCSVSCVWEGFIPGRAAVGVHVGSRILLRSMGIRVVRHGGVRDGAALVVANHVSWLDVPVIAAMTPVVPVAKDEVIFPEGTTTCGGPPHGFHRVLRSGPLVAHVRWQPPVPAIQDRAHRARHRARAASRAHGRISRALAA